MDTCDQPVMDTNNSNNQAYWFVLREDQGNVIYSTSNITLQTDAQELSSVVEPNNQYVRVTETLQQSTVPVQNSELYNNRRRCKDDENLWDKNKIKLLLTLCLKNRSVDTDTTWEEVGRALGVSPEQCSLKYRHLRRTYLRLLKKKRLGKDIKWTYYNICDEVFTELKALPAAVLEPWEDAKVRRLLTLYIDNILRFRNPKYLQKDIWKDIATQLDTTGYNCYHKFKNLRRSYLNWLNRSRETGKGIKWPYQSYFDRIYYNYRPATTPWDRNKIKLLLQSYARLSHKFRSPKTQKKELWKEVSNEVGESPMVCDKKFRNLKQTYVRLKMKANSGRVSTNWRYYRDFELICGSLTKHNIQGGPTADYSPPQELDYVKVLLNYYIDNKDKFRDPRSRKKTLWKAIAPELGLTSEECDKKFRNLKQTYIRLAWKKNETGKSPRWPYFSHFERIFSTSSVSGAGEVRRALEGLRDRSDHQRAFHRLVQVAEDSNIIQRERNNILLALIHRK